jgi:hypothetical protein
MNSESSLMSGFAQFHVVDCGTCVDGANAAKVPAGHSGIAISRVREADSRIGDFLIVIISPNGVTATARLCSAQMLQFSHLIGDACKDELAKKPAPIIVPMKPVEKKA